MTLRNDRLPAGLIPPGPPPELRQRVLGAAREAMGRTGSPDIWSRIWNSRPAHFAWAASVAGLLFGHIVLGGGGPTPPVRTLHPAAAASLTDEIEEIALLPRLTVKLPAWEVSASATRNRVASPSESEDRS